MHQFLTVVSTTSGSIYDLTTVEAVNAEFSLESNTASDAKIQADITENSRIIADLCGRVFALQSVIETFRISIRDPVIRALNLSRYPVTQFTSLTIGGIEANADSYEIDNNAGVIYLLRHSRLPHSGKFIATYEGGYNLPDEAPSGLARACIESIRDDRTLNARSTHPGVQDVWAGDNRVRYFDINQKAGAGSILTGVSAMIEGLIAPYRRLAV